MDGDPINGTILHEPTRGFSMNIQPVSSQSVFHVTGAAPTTMTSPPPSPHLAGTLDGIAGALGMPTSAVQLSLRQGASITALAAQTGVSRESLVTQVTDQIQQRRSALGLAPQDATTINRMINRAFDRGAGAGAA